MNKSRIILFSISLGLLISCKNDDDSEMISPSTEVNNWIFDTMDEVYFWTDRIPDQVNKGLEPAQFFESLLFSGDRFSLIVDDYDELTNSLEGITRSSGYSFVLARESNTDNVIMPITYVQFDSPARDAGLKRGDIITAINGAVLTLDNYRQQLDQIEAQHEVTYIRFNEASQSYDQLSTSLSVSQLNENPNFLDTVYVTKSGAKVGYYVYNFFSSGPGNTSTYDDQMDAIFSRFQAEGISELILDLRYNSGGTVVSATNLGSLIAPGVDENSIFYQNQWNDLYQSFIEGLEDGDDILRGKFENKSSNVGSQLASSKLYVLTGDITASASELIINGLLPYMDVEIIGTTTIGKNVGSIPIEDEDNPSNDYGLLPIVFQIANSNGQSDYSNGFTPSVANQIDELSFLPLTPLGDISEPLLNRALELIDPTMGGRLSAPRQLLPAHIALFYSQDNYLRTNQLILELN